MIHAQMTKVLPLVLATAATNATASAQASVARARYAVVKVTQMKATATDSSAKILALKVQGGNSSTGSWTDLIAGTTNATAGSTEFVLAAHNDTSVPGVTKIFVDLTKYPYSNLNVVYTAPTGHTTLGIEIETSRAEIVPDSATTRGLIAQAFA